jgi:hypothetical protein
MRRLAILVSALVAGLALGAAVVAADPGDGNGQGNAFGHDKQKDKDGAEQTTDAATTETAPAGPAAAPAPAPALGAAVGVAPAKGTVRVRRPDGTWSALDAGAAVPNGTQVDATRGEITLTAVADASGATQAATFGGGRFTVRQPAGSRPVTELRLSGSLAACRRRARTRTVAVAAARRRPVRRLFGRGKGRFRTRGSYASAAVRGTSWVTEDFCDRTVIRVRSGVVAVRDLRSGRTVAVRAGRSRVVRRR